MQRYFLNKGASQNLIYCDVTPRPFAFSIGKHNFLADALLECVYKTNSTLNRIH